MKEPVYLVPIDFSEVSIQALESAVGLAEYNNGSVMCLHIVSKKSEKQAAKTKMTELLRRLNFQNDVQIECRALVGNIYEDIAMVAEIIDASLIVLGTHGAVGLQKVFGSHALRLVSSTGVPFVILQEGSKLRDIENIVMPFNFEKETIQIATFAGYIAKQFDAVIHLAAYIDEDAWLKGASNANQIVIRKYFDQRNVKYQIVNLPKSKSYTKALLNYADEINADLIASSFFVDTILPTMNSFVQELIDNKKQIPLLTANAEDLTITQSYSFLRT